MPNKYTYSRLAQNDLIKIYKDSAGKWGFEQAEKYQAEIERSLQLLAENPDMGRLCEWKMPVTQRHECQRHIIFYRKRKNDILISRILHERMDVKRRL